MEKASIPFTTNFCWTSKFCKNLGSDEINRRLLVSLPIKWRHKVTTIEEAKNLKIITTKWLSSLNTHEHTLERDQKEKELDKKKKKEPCKIRAIPLMILVMVQSWPKSSYFVRPFLLCAYIWYDLVRTMSLTSVVCIT